ncbi:MAG: hypothetical protein JO250_24685 [Armatimonadetes bacterium]|nr:hypothetical protein [Armatimonadota bacterium]
MDQTATLETPTGDVAELQAGIAQCLTEIEQLREQMSRDQVEIERSCTRTCALLAELKATLSSAGRRAA